VSNIIRVVLIRKVQQVAITQKKEYRYKISEKI